MIDSKNQWFNLRLVGLGILAAVPSLAALAVFGVIHTPDSAGYLAFAHQIKTGTVPSGAALLHESSMPFSLYRIGGFPALLAGLQILFPKMWPDVLVLLQIVAQAAIVPMTYCVAVKLGAKKHFAALAALSPAIGFVVVTNICVLSDSLSDAAMTGAALILILSRSVKASLTAGLMIAFATTFREATAFFAFAYIPLAIFTTRKPFSAVLIVIPAWIVVGAQLSWNISRGAGPELTTVEQVVMVQAILPLLQNGVPVYNTDSVFDKVANETVKIGGFSKMRKFEDTLFLKYGLTAPKIANIASKDYIKTWLRFPLRMTWATTQNFNHVFLFMPFQPISTIEAAMVYSGRPRPSLNRLNILWTSLTHGSALSGILILLNILSQIIALFISYFGIIGPWVNKNSKLLRAMWCLPAGLVTLYLPVHLETRYLIPIVPIICIIAVVAISKSDIQKI